MLLAQPTPVAVWLDAADRPARLVYQGTRFTTIDEPGGTVGRVEPHGDRHWVCEEHRGTSGSRTYVRRILRLFATRQGRKQPLGRRAGILSWPFTRRIPGTVLRLGAPRRLGVWTSETSR